MPNGHANVLVAAMTTREKALVGAAGGVALALLKLIEVKFFVDDFTSKVAVAAFLTYFAYIVLGVMVAMYFTNDALEPSKRRQSAFVTGLAAPSILIAVIGQPVKPLDFDVKGGTSAPGQVPTISFFLGTARAQSLPTPLNQSDEVRVVNLKKDDVVPGYIDGVQLAIGRPNPAANNTFLYAVGRADSKDKAEEVAADINKLLKNSQREQYPKAHVFRPEGTNDWFVTMGGLSDPRLVDKARQETRSAAFDILSGARASTPDKSIARLMHEGRIIDAASLFRK